MFGFNNYSKPGKGISKNEPKKRAFFRFVELFTRKFWKLLLLNIVYFLFCVPIITIGPATAALCAVVRNFILERPVFIFSDFWSAFKENFKQSLFVGIADVLLLFVYLYTLVYYDISLVAETGMLNTFMLIITIMTAIILIVMHFYIYLQIASLNLKLSDILRNSLLFVFLGIKQNIITLGIVVPAVYFFAMYLQITIFLIPFLPAAWLCFLSVFNSYPVIQKYIINPYYEKNNLINPEASSNAGNEECIFTDTGGSETDLKSQTEKSKTVKKGKTIK